VCVIRSGAKEVSGIEDRHVKQLATLGCGGDAIRNRDEVAWIDVTQIN
jgi:hypothetical protein